MDAIDPRAALVAAAGMRGETLAGLSRWLGRNAAYLQQYVKRGTPRVLPERERRRLVDYLGVAETALGGPSSSEAGVTRVRRLDVRAAAGAGGLADDDPVLGDVAFDARLVATLGVRADALSLVRAQGDSMEPLIRDGDLMLVDGSDRAALGRGGVHVIRLDDALQVKRLHRVADGFEISSENPAYPPVIGRPDVIGRVVWLARGLDSDDDTDGHVDRFLKPVPSGDVLLQHVDDDHVDFEALTAAAHSLQHAGIDVLLFDVVAFAEDDVPFPYLAGYACNDAVLVPQSGDPVLDERAVEVYRLAFPEREPIGVAATALALGGGGVSTVCLPVPGEPA